MQLNESNFLHTILLHRSPGSERKFPLSRIFPLRVYGFAQLSVYVCEYACACITCNTFSHSLSPFLSVRVQVRTSPRGHKFVCIFFVNYILWLVLIPRCVSVFRFNANGSTGTILFLYRSSVFTHTHIHPKHTNTHTHNDALSRLSIFAIRTNAYSSHVCTPHPATATRASSGLKCERGASPSADVVCDRESRSSSFFFCFNAIYNIIQYAMTP